MHRICEVCGRMEEVIEEPVDHDILDVCGTCTDELTAHTNTYIES
ncbi:hypothetical protein [Evansella halocellulosilytica]|nr:hypothetical protein [Evansella halocellulosilytica]